MVGGFNTNVRYRGRTYHVQTEDGGADSPHIITLLYEGGAILFSKKSSYAERLGEDQLEEKVRELMEEQHKTMVTALKGGKLDGKLGGADDDDAPTGGGAPAQAEFGAGVFTETRLDELILSHLG